MKTYILKQKNDDDIVGKFETKAEAVVEMNMIINENNSKYEPNEESYLTPFDFELLEEEEDTPDNIPDFEAARKFLDGKPNADFTVVKKALSGNCVKLKDVAHLIEDINPRHIKALIALNELFTIAEAWNKADNFVPNFSNVSQYKYYPWFVYNNDAARFVCANTNYAASYVAASFGSRLCFKTSNRARQFGEMFQDLYNQVFQLNDKQL